MSQNKRTLRTITDIGMPWHGLASNGVLTTIADGNKTITGTGSVTLVRHPQAPGANRSVDQQALDAARGYDWRDYVLLTGDTRAFSGGVEIGANAWLYCAADGRTWRMTVEKNYSSGDTATFEVWRRELFGLHRDGGTPTITDELITSQAVQFVLPPEYSGGQTAANCANSSTAGLAACIVPDPEGALVYIHVVCSNNVYAATDILLSGSQRQTYAILTLSLSGNGDIDNTGIGISGSFTNVDLFATLRTRSHLGLLSGTPVNNLVPDWDTCSLTADNGPPTPDPPGSAGLSHTQTLEYTPHYEGTTNIYTTGTGVDSEATCYRTHQGDLVIERSDYSQQVETHSVNTGDWKQHTTSVSQSDGAGGYEWAVTGTTYTATNWHSSDSSGVLAEKFEARFAGHTFSEYWNYSGAHTETRLGVQGLGGAWCTVGWPVPDPADVNHPEVWNSSFGALSGGMSTANLDLSGSVSIYPGYMIISWAVNNPNNDGDRGYHYRFIGIGESSAPLWDSYDFDYDRAIVPPPNSYLPFRHSFQPVDLTGTYALDSGPSLQYC